VARVSREEQDDAEVGQVADKHAKLGAGVGDNQGLAALETPSDV
jgi:hypothetical protein